MHKKTLKAIRMTLKHYDQHLDYFKRTGDMKTYKAYEEILEKVRHVLLYGR